MLLLRASDFGDDGVLRTQLSTVASDDDGLVSELVSGDSVLVLVDDWPGRGYVLCADAEFDVLNIAIAGPRE